MRSTVLVGIFAAALSACSGATCVTEGDAVTANDPAADVARCRVRFAVTEVTVLPSG
jgi:hypothetical protein